MLCLIGVALSMISTVKESMFTAMSLNKGTYKDALWSTEFIGYLCGKLWGAALRVLPGTPRVPVGWRLLSELRRWRRFAAPWRWCPPPPSRAPDIRPARPRLWAGPPSTLCLCPMRRSADTGAYCAHRDGFKQVTEGLWGEQRYKTALGKFTLQIRDSLKIGDRDKTSPVWWDLINR